MHQISSFTLVELMVALAASLLVGGAILVSMVSLRKTFVATEGYSRDQASQLRLLEYVGRDLKASASSGTGNTVWTFSSSGTASIPTATFASVGAGTGQNSTLTILVPGYYTNGSGTTTNSLIYSATSGKLTYGSVSGTTTAITTGTVTYRKTSGYSGQNGVYNGIYCYIRKETTSSDSIGTEQVVADHADGLLSELMLSGTYPSAQYRVRTRFTPSFSIRGIPAEPVANDTDGLSAAQTVSLRQMH